MSVADMLSDLAQQPIVQSVRDLVTRFRPRRSYAQHGEDRFILDTIFKGKRDGFYIDIGASHPARISNTWLLYRHGWSGITIEPIRRLSDLHRRWRPRDRQVRALIGDTNDEHDFYSMYPSVLSTCSDEQYGKLLDEGYRLIERISLPQLTIEALLSMSEADRQVDFMSVDIEGLDVLIAAQLARLPDTRMPRCLCIECMDEPSRKAITKLLDSVYRERRIFGANLIFWN